MATDIAKQQEAAGQDIVNRLMRQYQMENPANAAQVRRLMPSAAPASKPAASAAKASKTGVLSPQEAAEITRQLDEKKRREFEEFTAPPVKKASGGSIKGYAKGGSVRGGGCERRGKTRGKFV
jgi:hypothetical protein